MIIVPFYLEDIYSTYWALLPLICGSQVRVLQREIGHFKIGTSLHQLFLCFVSVYVPAYWSLHLNNFVRTAVYMYLQYIIWWLKQVSTVANLIPLVLSYSIYGTHEIANGKCFGPSWKIHLVFPQSKLYIMVLKPRITPGYSPRGQNTLLF